MKKFIVLILSFCFLSLFIYSDYSNQKVSEAKYYDKAKVLRVKYTQGETFVKRSYDEGIEEATINLPIFEKDAIGTTDGRLEIYLGRLNYLRLDYDTNVTAEKAPELRTTNMSFRLNNGGIYLDIANLDYDKDIEIQTPDCGIFLLNKGLYRINVNQQGNTEIYVYKGIAEVAGDDYTRNVRTNQKIVMYNGKVKERPFYFYSSEKDDFDIWNQKRNNSANYSRYASSRYLEAGYEDYEYELSRNGRWRYNNTYNSYTWMPYNISKSWRPYYNGRWIWNPYYGNVWTSYNPWGWYTSHYGRWHWSTIDGWYWIPGYRWSPAWVSWGWNDYYYGWCPLSYYNRPVIVINGRWNRNYRYRNGFPFHSRSTIIIRKNHLHAPRISRIAIKSNSISKGTLAYKGISPRVRPHISKVSVINAKGKSVVYKRSGIVSTNKYKVIKSYPGVSKVNKNKNIVYKYSGTSSSKAKTFKYSASHKTKKVTYKKSSNKTYGTFKTDKKSTYKYSPEPKIKKKSSTYKYKSSSKSKKSSASSSKSSSSKKYKVKKKKQGPSYLSSSKYSSSSKRANTTSSYYASSKRGKVASYRSSYSPKYSNKSYNSHTYKSTKKYTSQSYPTNNRYYSSSYKYSSKPTYKTKRYYSSYKTYSKPSYKSSYKTYNTNRYRSSSPSYYSSSTKKYSSSYKTYSKPSTKSYSHRSYSQPSRSYSKSSYRSSSTRSSSSSKSYRKK